METDHQITVDALKAVGHPVTEGMPRIFHELMSLYRQPVRSTPSVQYLCEPRENATEAALV